MASEVSKFHSVEDEAKKDSIETSSLLKFTQEKAEELAREVKTLREDKIRALTAITNESELRSKIKAHEQTNLELSRKVNVLNHENSLLKQNVKNLQTKFELANKEKYSLSRQLLASQQVNF